MWLILWTLLAVSVTAIGLRGGSELLTGIGGIMILMTCCFAV